jgi:Uma2 family endonuclease
MSSNMTEAPDIADTSLSHAPSRRMTFEEYLASGDEPTMSEWVDGEVIFMSPAAEKHQALMLFLAQIVGLYVEVHGLGRIFIPPFAMKLERQRRGREPDLLFVSTERARLIKKTFLDGPADLVVEIVSPESAERDHKVKFAEYEQAGIKEYWLIDPDHQTAEFYELGADNRYRAAQTETDGIYRSKVINGFFIRIAWLWQTPPPTLDALRELKLI